MSPKKVRAALCLVLPVLLGAGSAVAQGIDDFESGPFQFVLPGNCCWSVPAGPPHTLSPGRWVGLLGPGQGTVDLFLTQYDDAALILGSDLTLLIEYDVDGQEFDLYGGNLYDRFQVGVTGPPGTLVTVEANDYVTQNVASATVPVDPSGVTEIPFAAMLPSPVDLHKIDVILLRVGVPAGPTTAVIVDDFRFARSALSYVDWDAVRDLAQWCPACAPESLTLEAWWGGIPDPNRETSIRVIDASSSDGTSPAVHLTAFDSGGGVGTSGHYAGGDLSWDELTDFQDAVVELELGFTGLGNVEIAFPPDPIVGTSGPASCALKYVLGYGDAATGQFLGNGVETLILDAMPGQPLELHDPVVTQVVPRGRGSSSFRVSFRAVAVGDVDEGLPLVTMQLVSDYVTGTAPTAAAPSAPRPASRGLVAAPSVTRAGTSLRLARPFAAPARLAVFDVTGRTVRRLPVPAGARIVPWDGRGESGAWLPAGVYFVSGPNGGPHETARVVLVR